MKAKRLPDDKGDGALDDKGDSSYYPSSFILHPSAFILHPSSFRLHPSSFRLHPCFRRGARVVELAALEMLCTGNRTVGSNPTLSASTLPIADCQLPIADCRLPIAHCPLVSGLKTGQVFQLVIDNRQWAIGNRQSAVGNRHSTTYNALVSDFGLRTTLVL